VRLSFALTKADTRDLSGNDNACVTVARSSFFTAIRDSKVVDGPAFRVTSEAWGAFTAALR
jgi:hypothetical protein